MREKTKNRIFVIDIAILVIALIIHFFSYYIYLKYAFDGPVMNVDRFCLFAVEWSVCGLSIRFISKQKSWITRFLCVVIEGFTISSLWWVLDCALVYNQIDRTFLQLIYWTFFVAKTPFLFTGVFCIIYWMRDRIIPFLEKIDWITLIFGEEDSPKEISKPENKKRNEKNELQVPKPDKLKYIFISYAHRDTEKVLPIITWLESSGYEIWYDNGIDPGTEWDTTIAERVKNSTIMLAFISENYLKSDNCKDELNFARNKQIDRILIYLENVELPDAMEMRLSRHQAIHFYKYSDKNEFYEKLCASEVVESCKK